MEAFILPFIVGIVLIVLGISNRKGNIGSLHAYHRKRVSEEDRLPFGKAVGAGCILVGAGVVANSVLSAVSVFAENDVFTKIGMAVMIVCMAVGFVMIIRAMVKYNKGIF